MMCSMQYIQAYILDMLCFTLIRTLKILSTFGKQYELRSLFCYCHELQAFIGIKHLLSIDINIFINASNQNNTLEKYITESGRN
jgi:hypothetical protein